MYAKDGGNANSKPYPQPSHRIKAAFCSRKSALHNGRGAYGGLIGWYAPSKIQHQATEQCRMHNKYNLQMQHAKISKSQQHFQSHRHGQRQNEKQFEFGELELLLEIGFLMQIRPFKICVICSCRHIYMCTLYTQARYIAYQPIYYLDMNRWGAQQPTVKFVQFVWEWKILRSNLEQIESIWCGCSLFSVLTGRKTIQFITSCCAFHW